MSHPRKRIPPAALALFTGGLVLLSLASCNGLMKLIFGNTPPVLSSLDLSAPNPRTGSPVTVIATASDADGDALSYVWILKAAPTGSSATVSGSAASATFTPDVEGSYTVQCTVSDGSGSAMKSLDVAVTAAAAAVDATPPTVASVSPASGAADVPVSSIAAAVFSEALDAATVSASTFLLLDGTTPVSGSVSWVAATKTAAFDPSSDLAASRTYTARITTGVQDAAGNPIAAAYEWSFTTAAAVDATPPTVASVSPASGAADVPVTSIIAAVFSEALDAATVSASTFLLLDGTTPVSGAVSWDPGTKTATFDPTADLTASRTYSARITTGVQDAAGNPIAAAYEWSFTTASPPAYVDYDVTGEDFPASGVVGTAYSVSFTVTNQGGLDGTMTVLWKLYLSNDAAINAGDTTLQQSTLAPLAAGVASSSISYSGTWPATAGSYHLILEITESTDGNSANNTSVSAPIDVTAIADYTVINPVYPGAGTLGGGFTGPCNFRIQNVGTADGASPINWTVYFSANAVYDAGLDVPADDGTLSTPLAAGVTSGIVSYTGAWPATAGGYYLIIRLSASDEGNTDNDVAVSAVYTLIASSRIIGVGQDGLIVISENGGQSWRNAVVSQTTSKDFVTVATNGNGFWVAAGGLESSYEGSVLYYSADDGENWAPGSLDPVIPVGNEIKDVVYHGGTWILAGTYSTVPPHVARSRDGINYTKSTTANNNYYCAAWDELHDKWLLFQNGNGYRYESVDDGLTFTGPFYDNGYFYDVLARPDGYMVSSGRDTDIRYSSDGGSTWTDATSVEGEASNDYYQIAYGGSTYVTVAAATHNGATGYGFICYSTDDGHNWYESSGYDTADPWYAAVYDPVSARFIAGGTAGRIVTSTDDGYSWTALATPLSATIYSLAIGPR